jgi:hypothetical protein
LLLDTIARLKLSNRVLDIDNQVFLLLIAVAEVPTYCGCFNIFALQ